MTIEIHGHNKFLSLLLRDLVLDRRPGLKMLTVVRFNKHAHHLIKLQRNTRVVSEFKALPVRRYFSTEPPPIKPDESSNTNQPKEQIPSNKTTSTPTPTPNPLMSVFRFLSTNLQQAYDEMTGKSKQSAIKRTVFQADSYRPPKKKVGEDGEEIEDELYEGPTSIVLVKDPISAWEHMRNRLHDSPLIQSILRGSNKVGKVVLETELGKGVQNASNKVKDKIEYAREYWETTQNPIVYTIANAWDSLTSETEEGMTITQIRKLDPQFMKVCDAMMTIVLIYNIFLLFTNY